MKASLTEDDCIFQVDFTESYRNDLQKSTQSAYFRDQSFSNFIAVVVTESSDHNSLVSMTCLKTVLDKTEKYEMVFIFFRVMVWERKFVLVLSLGSSLKL